MINIVSNRHAIVYSSFMHPRDKMMSKAADLIFCTVNMYRSNYQIISLLLLPAHIKKIMMHAFVMFTFWCGSPS